MNDLRPYRLVNYTSDWKKRFDEHAQKIRSVLNHEIISIDHVGSTSIPGMVAKPNIDIMVTVTDIDRVVDYRKKMEALGYISHGDYSKIDEEYFTEDLFSGERVVSIHVFQKGNTEISKHLNFRDYLTANKEARDRYVNKKNELYARYKDQYRKYDNGKHELINQLNREAAEWAIKIS